MTAKLTLKIKTEGLSPRVARLKGVIKLPEDFDYKKEIGKTVVKEYR